MKNINKIIFTVASGFVLLGLTSCDNDKYLSVDHYTTIDADQMFKSESDAAKGLIGCYDMMLPEKQSLGGVYSDNWNFKPQIMTGCHPTLDTQATGWDKDFCTESWTADNSDLSSGFIYSYRAISRCNDFLAGLETTNNVTDAKKKIMDGEAKALRAYFYMYLAETWGRVPMLATGETYVNTPNKARAATDAEMWDFIIKDLVDASNELNWDPDNSQYGRCTKGMALSYLGEAYMWKAFKTGDSSFYKQAATALKQVIDSGKYELNPSYTTLWDPGAVWTKECVWEVVLQDQTKKTSWNPDIDAAIFYIYNCACPELGGWGSLYLSWEWYKSFEKGDKRRDASAVTGLIPAEKGCSDYCYGYNPYTKQALPTNGTSSHYKYANGGEFAPSIWSLKWWRTARANYDIIMAPMQIYYKRYANVLFDYAECLFRINGGDDATAWNIIGQIRNRAFGNMEVGKSESLENTYGPYYKGLAGFDWGYGDYKYDGYPLPFNKEAVSVPDAKTYYTQVKADYGLTSPVWLVAVGMERRKEFNAEFCEKYDMQRSGFMEDCLTHCYPKGVGVPNTDATAADNWHTYRNFDYSAKKMIFPIPTNELLRNNLCDQNEGY